MILTCPHCNKINRVVGFFWRKPGTIEGVGADVNRLTCGHCGQQWVVEKDPSTPAPAFPQKPGEIK